MKKLIARTKEGLIGLPFGASRKAVVRAFGESPRVVDKIGRQYDFFFNSALSIQYDGDGGFVAVEFHPPKRGAGGLASISADDVVIEHERLQLLPFKMSAWDLLDHIRSIDPAVTVERDGFTSVKLGVGAYADWLMEPRDSSRNKDPVTTFIVFRDGYYSESEFLEATRQIEAWMRANGIEPA